MNETTRLFTEEEITDALIEQIINEVYTSLEEKGYDPIKQIVGYLITNDPGYISNYNGARTKIKMLDRTRIMETILGKYLGDDK